MNKFDMVANADGDSIWEKSGETQTQLVRAEFKRINDEVNRQARKLMELARVKENRHTPAPGVHCGLYVKRIFTVDGYIDTPISEQEFNELERVYNFVNQDAKEVLEADRIMQAVREVSR